MVGLELEETLAEAGFGVVGPFATSADASAYLERHGQPDVALIDYDLRDGSCESLLRALLAGGVPVLVHSGYQDRPAERPCDLRALPWIEKPASRSGLIVALTRLLDATHPSGAPLSTA